MCYDISFKTSMKTIRDYFPSIQTDPQIQMDFDNIHVLAQSFSKVPVIIFEDATYKLKYFEWGVIADYMNTPEKIKQSRQWMCNAQSEKILGDKRSYWHRIRKNRCLVPVTGFYEHREIKGWKNKVPYFIKLKNREIFCIPGLYHYSPVPDPETGEAIGTFTLITRSANSIMRQIHNGGNNAFRMPLLLPNELEQKWLLPDLSDNEIAEILDFEMPSEKLEYLSVFTIRTSKSRPDGKEKNELYQWPGLPPLEK
ncbi:MAG TPA: SOS response-associated peptidase family protein [Chitinophagaceae bacterium]|jgi:putative SOS response-associated peptidase YedK|nr:SOS response-associated peptidase family protein [Chitinophagaceae bacterium]